MDFDVVDWVQAGQIVPNGHDGHPTEVDHEIVGVVLVCQLHLYTTKVIIWDVNVELHQLGRLFEHGGVVSDQ